MSMVKKQNDCIQRSFGHLRMITSSLELEVVGVQKAQNVKCGNVDSKKAI